MKKQVKTNAMRILDQAKIAYEVIEYEVDENDLSGTHIADCVGLPYEIVFKTILLHGDKSGYIVCCLPCDKEVGLKTVAGITGNKKVEPVHVKELLGITGYIRGGCSPVGMKKKFPTYFDVSAILHERITISAGVRGMQLLLSSSDIIKYTDAHTCELSESEF